MTDELKHHAFISYAWVDNEIPIHKDLGWVSIFVDRLRKHLSREMRRRTEGDRIWIDYERMRGNQPLSEAIRAELSASRLLVPVISPSYFASPWCRQELETFLGLHGADTDRIFPVWMEPVDPEEVPDEARPLAAAIDARLKYEFWYRDEERRIQTRWFPDIEPTDREYGRMQQRMAREMAALLRGLVGDERPSGATAGQNQAPLIAGDHLIMINGGDADADQVLQVAERLWADHQVGSVVPLVAQKDKSDLKPSEITKDLRDNLGLCTAVLMLYCTGPRTQVHQQLKEYQRHTAKLPKGMRPPRLALCHSPPGP